MPRVYLAFDTVTEKKDLEMAMAGHEYKFALSDLDDYLRNQLKYENLSKTKEKHLTEIREKLVEILNERGLL
jgi:hypothetical protein